MILVSASASAQTVISAKQAGESIEIRNLRSDVGVISGEIVNHSRYDVRNVELLIQNIWQWKNEFQPGHDDLGTASYYTVEGMIAAGATVPFTHRVRTTPTNRTDGQHETVVSVVGFSEIIP
jgi:hypothetical protein